MGYQIIRQPGTDRYGIFTRGTDTFVAWDGSEAEIIEWFVQHAAERARADAARVLAEVKAGQSRRVYAQFALSWGEAMERHQQNSGGFSEASAADV